MVQPRASEVDNHGLVCGVCVYVCISRMYVCMYIMCISGAHRGQKMALIPLELELQMPVSHQMDPENVSQLLCKSSKCS